MATLTIAVAGLPLTGSKVFTMSDADETRLINWAIKAYATPATVGNPNPPALTSAQALVAWATAWVEATKASVVSSEAATAAAALAAPTPIATS